MEREELLPFCECGCGKRVTKSENRFINGHQRCGKLHSTKSKELMSTILRKHNPKPIALPCECGCGKLANPGDRFIHGHNGRGENNGMYESKCSQETRDKMKKSSKDRWDNQSERDKVSKKLIGRKLSLSHRTAISLATQGVLKGSFSDEHRAALSAAHIGILWSDEHRSLMTGENNSNWKGGISFEPYCPKFTEKLKQQIRDLYNNCDFVSGLPDYICNMLNGKVHKLSIHHIDYNKMQGCDGHKWGLIPLSLSNHARTNYNRPFWEKLICYALEYDETYYNDGIKDIMG